ncbi:hypothetical protein TVAG_119880 [Trichomonas vaginalis G3]|uniref:DUF3447 domain-containing protein n=1 Tax=Trichomonas vaginalis (strain ATCC PRA-98 / G3) TaxID=412133 RepID=A2D7D4_TRIV3|nr:protein ubiquitination [Trichomonas vaginalis G3]EAY23651.1 hypothetical protein TVAG_119880 [Trichomonas vaginalis G3]KAI5490143.1 protein ubiquitination [Trichomonas vaginalis G3]|eukprot:XP_001276899.1 hypothetical protein [Trichomonas vaginalis G3]
MLDDVEEVMKNKDKYFDSANSILSTALKYGSINVFKFIFEQPDLYKSVDPVDAVKGGNLELFKIVAESGVNLDKCLRAAVRYHRNEFADYLMHNYTFPKITAKTCLRATNLRAFFCLIDHGFNVNEHELNHPNCLNVASYFKDMKLINFLMRDMCSQVVEYSKYEDEHPLILATKEKDFSLIEFLIKMRRFNINMYAENGPYVSDMNPVLVAVEENDVELLKHLISLGAEMKFTRIDYDTLLTFAIRKKCSIDMIKFLVEECKLNVNAKIRDVCAGYEIQYCFS